MNAPDEAVYGFPPPALATTSPGALQVSPLVPGAAAMEDLDEASLARFTLFAPPGTLERRFAIAQALRALVPGGALVVLAPKTRGGGRLTADLAAFDCEVRESARRHHRICKCRRPEAPAGIAEAIAAGGPQRAATLDLWSQPGVFSWDRVDPGTALLLAQTWAPSGKGADLGCGVGILGQQVLRRPEVTAMSLIDIDRRAIGAARRNLADPRASFLQHDLRAPPSGLAGLDFAIMNPPFHEGGDEDRALSRAFVVTARSMLRDGGVLRLVANVALPYEQALAGAFAEARLIVRDGGYKVLEARR